MTAITVRPLSAVADTPYFIIQSDRTALRNASFCSSIEACPQFIGNISAIILAQTFVELRHGDAVLECTVLNEVSARDVLIVARHAHYEAEIDLRVGIEMRGTELDHVTKTLFFAMLALDSVTSVTIRATAQSSVS